MGKWLKTWVFWAKVRHLAERVWGRLIPTMLPIGVAAHEQFADSIIKTYGLPDFLSYRRAIAEMVMHLGPDQASIKKYYLYRLVHKRMATQIAFHVIEEIKTKEEQKLKEDAAKDQAIVTVQV